MTPQVFLNDTKLIGGGDKKLLLPSMEGAQLSLPSTGGVSSSSELLLDDEESIEPVSKTFQVGQQTHFEGSGSIVGDAALLSSTSWKKDEHGLVDRNKLCTSSMP